MNAITERNTITAELSYGEKAGQLLHISSVTSGLECDCICPACKVPLIARKGDIRTHHFAHHQGTESPGCVETSLHLFAKQVLIEHRKVSLPEDILTAKAFDKVGNLHQRQTRILSALIEFDKVGLEILKGNYRSDATGMPYENQDLDIEITVTHEVDQQKQNKAVKANACMMEIDLSDLPRDSEPEAIIRAVIYEAPRHWINNPVHQKWLAELQEAVNQQVIESDALYEKEIEASSRLNLIPEQSENHILLGYKVGNGYSPRYQKSFELCKVYIARKVVSSSTRNFTCTNSGGFEMEEFNLDERCISKLATLKYPIEACLKMGSKLRGRSFVPVIMDIEV